MQGRAGQRSEEQGCQHPCLGSLLHGQGAEEETRVSHVTHMDQVWKRKEGSV